MSYTNYQAAYPSGLSNNDYMNVSEDTLNMLKIDLDIARIQVNSKFINTMGTDAGKVTGFLVDRLNGSNKLVYYDFKPSFQKIPMITNTVYNKTDDGLVFLTNMTLQHPDYALHPNDFPDYCVVSMFAGYYSFPIDTSA